jgi:hypothetical protein
MVSSLAAPAKSAELTPPSIRFQQRLDCKIRTMMGQNAPDPLRRHCYFLGPPRFVRRQCPGVDPLCLAKTLVI